MFVMLTPIHTLDEAKLAEETKSLGFLVDDSRTRQMLHKSTEHAAQMSALAGVRTQQLLQAKQESEASGTREDLLLEELTKKEKDDRKSKKKEEKPQKRERDAMQQLNELTQEVQKLRAIAQQHVSLSAKHEQLQGQYDSLKSKYETLLRRQ
eukprot:TRINITY_DN6096_c0_g1::TRINITY_DN6096_c0_g1_i1::g.25664::m.25664 TRINITY_DN6096_c0_g1::TRINITY_DN6096_c0_g1_i1::g.25664  ORF type:complete len:173 (+),score=11.81,Sporozoite_P67/PF05642.6/0.13,AAA_23/PF13476.1/2.7,APG6/PF04111.7/8.8 TRINITY_DN6096_c0_g1_i1:65-520(+)